MSNENNELNLSMPLTEIEGMLRSSNPFGSPNLDVLKEEIEKFYKDPQAYVNKQSTVSTAIVDNNQNGYALGDLSGFANSGADATNQGIGNQNENVNQGENDIVNDEQTASTREKTALAIYGINCKIEALRRNYTVDGLRSQNKKISKLLLEVDHISKETNQALSELESKKSKLENGVEKLKENITTLEKSITNSDKAMEVNTITDGDADINLSPGEVITESKNQIIKDLENSIFYKRLAQGIFPVPRSKDVQEGWVTNALYKGQPLSIEEMQKKIKDLQQLVKNENKLSKLKSERDKMMKKLTTLENEIDSNTKHSTFLDKNKSSLQSKSKENNQQKENLKQVKLPGKNSTLSNPRAIKDLLEILEFKNNKGQTIDEFEKKMGDYGAELKEYTDLAKDKQEKFNFSDKFTEIEQEWGNDTSDKRKKILKWYNNKLSEKNDLVPVIAYSSMGNPITKLTCTFAGNNTPEPTTIDYLGPIYVRDETNKITVEYGNGGKINIDITRDSADTSKVLSQTISCNPNELQSKEAFIQELLTKIELSPDPSFSIDANPSHLKKEVITELYYRYVVHKDDTGADIVDKVKLEKFTNGLKNEGMSPNEISSYLPKQKSFLDNFTIYAKPKDTKVLEANQKKLAAELGAVVKKDSDSNQGDRESTNSNNNLLNL